MLFFSTTRQRAGSTPARFAPSKYGSGLEINFNNNIDVKLVKTYSGFPFSTSSETTKTSGTGTPTAFKADVAYTTVADVQMAHLGFGNL